MGAPPDPSTLDRPWLASYPPGVPPTYHLPPVAVTRYLDDAARDFPERTALVAGDERIDHATLRLRADTVATGLRERGLVVGDRVLVALPSGAAAPVVLLALWRLGAVPVVVDPDGPGDRIAAVAEAAGARAVVATGPVVERLREQGVRAPLLLSVTGSEWSRPGRLARVVPAGIHARRRRRSPPDGTDGAPSELPLAALLEGVDVRAVPPPPAHDAPALLTCHVPSSGAHGAVLTHRNLVAASFQARLWVPDVQAGREVVLVTERPCDTAALTVGWLAGLLAGAAVVLADRPEPAELARAIRRERPTLLVTTPARVRALLAAGRGRRDDLTSLRVVLVTGAPLDHRSVAELERRTAGARVRGLFGIAEAAGLSHGQPVYGRADPASMGLPVTSTVAAVVDTDDPGAVLPPGMPGRLVVAGPQVAGQPWGAPPPAGRSLVDGWLVTDDLVVCDDAGVFSHIGREGEVVRRGDVLVSLRRVEEELAAHPSVAQAGAVGDGGQLLAAVTPRRRGRAEVTGLEDHVRGRLGSVWVPDRIAVVDELPVDATGELARDALRRVLVEEGTP